MSHSAPPILPLSYFGICPSTTDKKKRINVPQVVSDVLLQTAAVDHPEINALKSCVFQHTVWNTLLLKKVAVTDERSKILQARLIAYPTVPSFWKEWIATERILGNMKKADELESYVLQSCVDMNFWKDHVAFNKTSDSCSHDNKEKLKALYELALTHVGYDVESGSLWKEYLELMLHYHDPCSTSTSSKTTSPTAGGEHIVLLRSLFRTALEIPHAMINDVWRMYDTWENKIDISKPKAIAPKMLSEMQPHYFQVRKDANARTKLKRALRFGLFPRPAFMDATQIKLWREFIQFEINLINGAASVDASLMKQKNMVHQHRVHTVFNQALSQWPFSTELWFDWGHHEKMQGRVDNARKIWTRGCLTLATGSSQCIPSPLLHLSLARLEEEDKDRIVPYAQLAYRSMVDHCCLPSKSDLSGAWMHFFHFLTKRQETSKKKCEALFEMASTCDSFGPLGWCSYAELMWSQHLLSTVEAINGILTRAANRFPTDSHVLKVHVDFLCSHREYAEASRVLTHFSESCDKQPIITTKKLCDKATLDYICHRRSIIAHAMTAGVVVMMCNTSTDEKKQQQQQHPLLQFTKQSMLPVASACTLTFLHSTCGSSSSSSSNDSTSAEEDVVVVKVNPRSNLFPKPDVSLLLPLFNGTGHLNVFTKCQLPPVLYYLCSILPNETMYQGPSLNIDTLMSLIATTTDDSKKIVEGKQEHSFKHGDSEFVASESAREYCMKTMMMSRKRQPEESVHQGLFRQRRDAKRAKVAITSL
jgi:hypothetical protein